MTFFFMFNTYPRATSRVIIMAKPSMAPMVARSVMLVHLRFGDQLLDHDVDHGAGGKGQGIGQDRLHQEHQRPRR